MRTQLFCSSAMLLASAICLRATNLQAQKVTINWDKTVSASNKRDKDMPLDLPANAKGAKVSYVDITTSDNPVGKTQLETNIITLKPYAVAVISFD